MNYELAKELKDAGWPQVYNGGSFVLHSFNEDETGITSANDAYAPTLSELIEACGDRGFVLERFAEKHMWEASVKEDGVWWAGEEGNTPEEAVARLWIALNKKSA